MKNKKITLRIICFTALITAAIFSCQKKLDKTDPNVVTVDQYFKTSSQILSGTNSIYSVLHSSQLVAREWFFVHDLRSDEVAAGGSQLEVPRGQMLNGNTDPSNPLVSGQWNSLYAMVHRANTVIENSANGQDDPTLTARAVAEAKFLRAWAYNELVTMWGSVPLYTATVKSTNAYQSRVKVDDIYNLIIKDLQDAASVLPGKSGYTGSDQGRATNAAANALLGRVYMQRGDYTNAKATLLKIQAGGADGYSLTGRYLNNFEEETEFNPESIFEVVFVDKGNNGFNWGFNNTNVGDGPSSDQATVRNQEYNGVAWRNLIPSNKYLNEFENIAAGAAKTDPRFSYSVYQSGDVFNNGNTILTDGLQNGNSSVLNGVTKKISWRKYTLMYKEFNTFHPGGNNQRLIRYAEVLLGLAECENELGNLTNAVAYLNQIRDRADVMMPHYPTAQFPVANKDQVTKAIMHEKMVEMGCEEVRNIDILRWRAKGYFAGGDPLPYFKANRDELLPIPQSEIDNNPQLGAGGIDKQNPGY